MRFLLGGDDGTCSERNARGAPYQDNTHAWFDDLPLTTVVHKLHHASPGPSRRRVTSQKKTGTSIVKESHTFVSLSRTPRERDTAGT
jgi:hypothetical protein